MDEVFLPVSRLCDLLERRSPGYPAPDGQQHLQVRVLLLQCQHPIVEGLLGRPLGGVGAVDGRDGVVLDGGEGEQNVGAEERVDVFRLELALARTLLGPAGVVAGHAGVTGIWKI